MKLWSSLARSLAVRQIDQPEGGVQSFAGAGSESSEAPPKAVLYGAVPLRFAYWGVNE